MNLQCLARARARVCVCVCLGAIMRECGECENERLCVGMCMWCMRVWCVCVWCVCVCACVCVFRCDNAGAWSV